MDKVPLETDRLVITTYLPAQICCVTAFWAHLLD